MTRLLAALLTVLAAFSAPHARSQGTGEVPIWNVGTGQGLYSVRLSNLNGAYLLFTRNDGGLGQEKASFEYYFPGIEPHADKEKTLTFIIDGVGTNYYFGPGTAIDLGEARADSWYCPFMRSLRKGKSLRIVSRAIGVDQSFSLAGAAQKLKDMECTISLCNCTVGGTTTTPTPTPRPPATGTGTGRPTPPAPAPPTTVQPRPTAPSPAPPVTVQPRPTAPSPAPPTTGQPAPPPPLPPLPKTPPVPTPAGKTKGPKTSIVIRRDLGVRSARELTGARLCSVAGSATETAALAYFQSNNVQVELVQMASPLEAIKAYDVGECDGLILATGKARAATGILSQPSEHMILPENLGLPSR